MRSHASPNTHPRPHHIRPSLCPAAPHLNFFAACGGPAFFSLWSSTEPSSELNRLAGLSAVGRNRRRRIGRGPKARGPQAPKLDEKVPHKKIVHFYNLQVAPVPVLHIGRSRRISRFVKLGNSPTISIILRFPAAALSTDFAAPDHHAFVGNATFPIC